MSDIIEMQMNRDNLAVSEQKTPTIDDILSKHKNINNSKNDLNKKLKVNNNEPKIANNEIINKENKGEIVHNKKIKKGFKDIFPIILNAFLGFIVFLDFILFLFSPDVRIYLL